MREKTQASDALVTEAEQRCLELKIELKRFKEKSHNLESELDQIRQKNADNNNLNVHGALQEAQASANNFDNEIRKMKEVHTQQMAQVKSDNQKLKQQA